jgi:hypothetical protein
MVCVGLFTAVKYMRYSTKKSKFIREISVVLGNTSLPTVNDLLNPDNKKDEARERMFKYCLSDPILSQIIQKHNATKDDLENLYTKILVIGAGQWVKGHFVAVSALLFHHTLDYLLGKYMLDEIDPGETYRVIKYFQNNESKPIIIRVHILDPYAEDGYVVTNWSIGEEINQDLVDKFRDPETGDLYVIFVYEEGEKRTVLLKKEKFNEAFEQMNSI